MIPQLRASKPASMPRPLDAARRESELLILGETTFRNQHLRFGILPADRLRHLWVLGKTGSGKSTLLLNMIAQDLAGGRGFALLDPHGDLVRDALALVPSHRVNHIVLFEPEDAEHPVSFNPFRQARKEGPADAALLASTLVSVFKKQWSESWGPRLEHILRNAILAVANDPRATLLFLYRFLTEDELRSQVVSKLEDPVVHRFWTREFPSYGDNLRGEALSPVLNKLGSFIANPLIRSILAQEGSRVDLVELMNDGKVLLANLSTGAIGEDASLLLGGLLLSTIQLSAMARGTSTPPFFLYVDEFQRFATDALSTLLSESRKFGVGVVLAHQYLGQLPENLRGAVLGNVGSIVLFRLGAEDAEVLGAEVFPVFNPSDLQELPERQAAVRLIVNGRQERAFSARTLPPPLVLPDARARVDRIRRQSRERYATDGARIRSFITGTMLG
jgi:hypothetical protein